MNSQLRTCLLVSLVATGWLVFAAATAEAQPGFVARAAVNQYLNGAYGGYGGYGYQPQYYGGYGGYGNGYSYNSYGNSGYGNGGYGYGSSYPAFGYNGGYGYSRYPAYGYRGSYYGY